MVIAWFSCGATSAVACKMALSLYKDVQVYYIETHSGHPDNIRFLKDCEKWFGRPIHVLCSAKYRDVEDVIRKRKYINGPFGAPCTFHLKKQVRYELEKKLVSWEGQVWGFDFSKKEINRAIRLKQQYPSLKALFPLIEKGITKESALQILIRSGIELPVMYQLGFHNNNCIGCVKGGAAYWLHVRDLFPDTFRKMALLERSINATCINANGEKIWLDELKMNDRNVLKPIEPSCDLFCEIEFQNMMDTKTDLIYNGLASINDI